VSNHQNAGVDASAAKAAFLEALSRCGGLLAPAAQEIGRDRKTIYRWLKSDPEFRREFEQAKEGAADKAKQRKVELAETELYRRGFEGVDTPVYQGGKLVGTVRKHDTLAAFGWLRAHCPTRWARPEIPYLAAGNGEGKVGPGPDLSRLSDGELQEFRDLARKTLSEKIAEVAERITPRAQRLLTGPVVVDANFVEEEPE